MIKRKRSKSDMILHNLKIRYIFAILTVVCLLSSCKQGLVECYDEECNTGRFNFEDVKTINGMSVDCIEKAQKTTKIITYLNGTMMETENLNIKDISGIPLSYGCKIFKDDKYHMYYTQIN